MYMPVAGSPLRNSVSPRLSARRVHAAASRANVAASSDLNSGAPASRTSGAISRRVVVFKPTPRSTLGRWHAEPLPHDLSNQHRSRIHHLFLGAGVLRQRLGKRDDLAAAGTRGSALQLVQRLDDGAVFGQHLRQLGLELVGEPEHLRSEE